MKSEFGIRNFTNRPPMDDSARRVGGWQLKTQNSKLKTQNSKTDVAVS